MLEGEIEEGAIFRGGQLCVEKRKEPMRGRKKRSCEVL
jgi:hypothetical protein